MMYKTGMLTLANTRASKSIQHDAETVLAALNAV